MDILLLQVISAGLYTAVILSQNKKYTQQSLAWCACAAHMIGGVLALGGLADFSLNAAHAFNFSMAFVVLGFLISSLKHNIQVLGFALYPLAGVSNLLALGSTQPDGEPISTAILIHIVFSMIAFSMIALGAMEAILIQILRYRLKNHKANALDSIMPPLQTLETILFNTIRWGTILLSAAIVTGISFVEQYFSAELLHKTTLTLLAWCIFFGVVIARSVFGWSGQRMTRLILIGYLLLLLGFIGVKILFNP